MLPGRAPWKPLFRPAWQEEAEGSCRVVEAHTVWYKDGATIVALFALLFSIVSSVIASWHARTQDIQTAHLDLRAVLQRLTALPKESIEIGYKYSGRPDIVMAMSAQLLQEMSFLARQGADLTRRLGPKLVSSAEYLAIANAQHQVYNYKDEEDFNEQARKSATTANDKLAALRAAASLRFVQGRVDDGREELQKALEIFKDYTGYDPVTMAATNGNTHLLWAVLERQLGRPEIAEQQIELVEAAAASLPPSPARASLTDQIALLRNGGVAVDPPAA